MLGQVLAVLLNSRKSAGFHEVIFEAKNLVSGVYIYTIEAGNFKQAKKMLLLK
jgi:hypothetical protein